MNRLLILSCLLSLCLLSSCNSKSQSEEPVASIPEPVRDTVEKIVYVEKEPVLTKEQLQERLKNEELKDALKYVSVSYFSVKPKYKKVTSGGIFKETKSVRVGDIITGSIANAASVASFQDPRVTVNWYSIEGNLINTSNTRLYYFLYPQTQNDFEFEVPYVKDATRIDVRVTFAGPFIGVHVEGVEEAATE